MGIKGCWTCRARKVRCDLHRPFCNNCIKTGQQCRGYGVQLSWPREGDKRRAVVYHDTKGSVIKSRRSRRGGMVFLNTFVWDVSLSHVLEEGRDLDQYLHTMHVPHLPYLSPSLLSKTDARLLDYFHESRSRILAPILDDTLAKFIMRVALFNPSSSNVVLQGVFTLSSLQLYGHSKSLVLQGRLLSMLQDSILQLDRESVLQNLIATMLLYQYEVTSMSSPGKRWRLYLCGAKKIIHAAASAAKLHHHDTAILMDWIYYHEVMSEFSIRHWLDADSIDSFCKGPLAIRPKKEIDISAPSSITCPIDVLDLVRKICKRPPTTHTDSMIKYNNADMQDIQHLKNNIYEIIGEYGPFHNALEPLSPQQTLTHLYRCAALIYLNRAVSNISPSTFSHKRLIREGILLLQKLGSCDSAWPLFILACEASEDEQRLQILDVLAETQTQTRGRANHVPLIRGMVEGIWKQNDLNVDGGVDYVRTLDAVVSTAESLPLFA